MWTESAPVSFLGLRLTSNMTVLRISDGNVLVHSPIVLTPERRAAVEALGPVAHLYAPNTFHQQWIGEWATAFPAALLHAPAGLAWKRPDLKGFYDRVAISRVLLWTSFQDNFLGASAHPEIANAAANDENLLRLESGCADT